MFEPFSAGALRSASGYESSGLGLAFCRLAVEAQGGTIRIEDNTPRGSVFVVDLPRCSSAVCVKEVGYVSPRST